MKSIIITTVAFLMVTSHFAAAQDTTSVFSSTIVKNDHEKTLTIKEKTPDGTVLQIPISVPDIQVRALAARRENNKFFVLLQMDEFYIEMRTLRLVNTEWEEVSQVKLCGMRGGLDTMIKSAVIGQNGKEISIVLITPRSRQNEMLVFTTASWEDAVLTAKKKEEPGDIIEKFFILENGKVRREKPPGSMLPRLWTEAMEQDDDKTP